MLGDVKLERIKTKRKPNPNKKLEDYLKADPTSKTGLRWIKENGTKVKVGDEAFTTKDKYGYYVGGFNYQVYHAHQIIMFLEHGEWSNILNHVDHIDGDKTNNNIDNLRFISPTGNQRNSNRKLNSNNKTGEKGLERISQQGYKYWRARYCGVILYTGNDKEIARRRLSEAKESDPLYHN